jgi:hypothetical protein
MPYFRCTVAFLLLLALAGPLAAQDEVTWRGNATLLLGSRHMSDGDLWQPDDTFGNLAIEVDWARSNWPINIVVGFELAKDSSEGMIEDPGTGQEYWSDVEAEIFQLHAGVQRYFRQEKRLQPYIGGALALLRAERELRGLPDVLNDNDGSIGALAKAGVRVRIGGQFYFGGDVRALLGSDLKLFDVSGNADHFQVSGTFAWGW